MKKLFSTLSIALILFSSCQKEVSETNNGGNSQNPSPTNADYQPTSKDSYWKYQDSSSYTGKEEILRSTGTTRNIDGLVWNELNRLFDGVESKAYVRKDGNKYFIRSKAMTSSGTMVEVNSYYLNDKEPVGFKWEHSLGSINGVPARFLGEIIERDINYTVKGKTYSSVIHTRLILQYNIMGRYSTWAIYDYYIAKGIGVIRLVSDVQIEGISILKTASNLIEYSIK